jgi:serine O-acetyltransferase
VQSVCVCEGGSLRSAFRDDLDRYVFLVQKHHGMNGKLLPLRVGLMSQGLLATTAYRMNHCARHRLRSRLPRLLASVFHHLVVAFTGISIDPNAHIGPGLKIPHGGKIVIGPVRAGRNCDIYHGATLGGGVSTYDGHDSASAPTLADRVWVGPGAVIAGEVTVGDDACVGANSLLVRNVPTRGVVVGVPARLVSRQGSFHQIIYRGMENDNERRAALAEDPEASPGLTG